MSAPRPSPRFSPITDRLASLSSAHKWRLHAAAIERMKRGEEVLNLTIGEPDFQTPPHLVETAIASLKAGRTTYSNGRGEAVILNALSERFEKRLGRPFPTNRFMAAPGTQGALYLSLSAMTGPGDEVLVSNPMYVTYEAVIRATGATPVPVDLRPELGFRMQADDLAKAVTPKTRAIFLNTPHNPTGAVLRAEDLAAILELAEAHDLWVLSDEVYGDLTHNELPFTSALSDPRFENRVVTVASISKSHAAPGFRTGWICGPEAFCERALPISETFLFGMQPFIADMAAVAATSEPVEAKAMAARMAHRARLLEERLEGVAGLHLHRPEAGMFALLDARALNPDSNAFAMDLLNATGVAAMPGASFGTAIEGWLRIALNAEDDLMIKAADRIAAFAKTYKL